jgi:flagellar protein FlaG
MALSPIAPAALQVQPPALAPAQAPAQSAETSLAVAPAGDTQKNSGADSATADASHENATDQQPLDKALEKINKRMEAWSTQATFSIDPDTHRVVVSIKDSKTGDVIRTIPSETVLRIAKMITEMQGTAIKTSA